MFDHLIIVSLNCFDDLLTVNDKLNSLTNGCLYVGHLVSPHHPLPTPPTLSPQSVRLEFKADLISQLLNLHRFITFSIIFSPALFDTIGRQTD